MEPAILNVALELAMTFGEDWLKPVQARLSNRYPDLSREQLDQYDAECREVMTLGQEQAPTCWQEAGVRRNHGLKLFRTAVRARFPWVNNENLTHPFSQGCYYAWKNGALS